MKTVETMSLDEKVGQLFVYAGHGVYANEQSPFYRDLVHQVRDNKVGGIIWFVSDVYETAWLTQRLQREAKIPLLVSADLEAGVGMRFNDTTFWPWAMAVAATGDPKLAEEMGRITARDAKVIGINHVLAPVADVNVDPDNPVINTRSFGEDPRDAARFVAAFVRGVQSEKVLATAKHFPGHGDTHVDSHRSLPVLDVTRERLDRVELVPFRAAIDAGVGSIMIGHLSVPALDPTPAPVREHVDQHEDNPYGTLEHETEREGTVPATISKPIITGLLRRDLHFDGLTVTDAFDMGGLVAHFDAGEAAVRAIEAGEDQVVKSANTDAAIAAVKEAVRSGRIPESRIDESVRRILAAKARVGVPRASQEEIFRTLDSPEHRAVATEIARRAVTLLREENGVLPLRKDARVVIVSVSDFPELANPLAAVETEVAARLTSRPASFFLDSRSRIEEAKPPIVAAQNADVVILALGIRVRSGAGHLAIPDAAGMVIEQLPPNVKTIAVSFGSPYLIRDLPGLKTYFCAYGVQPVMQTAAVQAIFGEISIGGRLPVTIPNLHRRGDGIQKTKDRGPRTGDQ
ncbi:MAG TPA: glycoside hydrolase family 3 N-terminal domain-containing protein [Thermoanaerobaculia bacterium]|nr:glycoside hydrolase family 3 N-terminal domain-containing protein [Thermoanaerobaculia bacterium]